MPWTPLGANELGSDKILTAPTMQALSDNPIAIANGDAGAPRIKEPAMNAASVNRAALKIASGSLSLSLAPGARGQFSFGQPLVFWPSLFGDGLIWAGSGTVDANAPQLRVQCNPDRTTNTTITIAYNYMAV